MTTLDILYIALAVGFLTLVGFVCSTLIELSRSLRELPPILKDIRDIADDIRSAKDSVKGAISAFTGLGDRLKKQK